MSEFGLTPLSYKMLNYRVSFAWFASVNNIYFAKDLKCLFVLSRG